LASGGPRHERSTSLPGIVSPADLRYLKAILRDFGVEPILLSDYSDTLDGPTWASTSDSAGWNAAWTTFVAWAAPGPPSSSARRPTPRDRRRAAPGAIRRCQFLLAAADGRRPDGPLLRSSWRRSAAAPCRPSTNDERGRLIDSYVDAHKYVFGKRAILYGEQDLVVAMASLLHEIGMVPALCATGSEKAGLAEKVASVTESPDAAPCVLEGADFAEIEEAASAVPADLVIGSSKGYRLARALGVPLVRVGFPIHDRIDGPRLLHLGYRGAQQLFDRIANALVGAAQDASPVGYSYM
jgi:nitrogenase molybdenum-iron protein NifN